MRSTSFIAVTLCTLSATVYSAPVYSAPVYSAPIYSTPTTPSGLSNIIGSITKPGSAGAGTGTGTGNGNGNVFKGNLNNNGNSNGNNNQAGNSNGNNNSAGNGNGALNGNSINFAGLKNILKNRGMLNPLQGLTSAFGAITKPASGGSGNANKFLNNLNGNGNGNGNGNSAGNGNGNGNSAGNGNTALSGNSINVSPLPALPALPAVTLPDVNFSPTINLARSEKALRQSREGQLKA